MVEIIFIVSGLYWSYILYDIVRIPEESDV